MSEHDEGSAGVDTAACADLADRLYVAMRGFGTDEDALYDGLREVLSRAQWRGVQDAFRTRHAGMEDGSLVRALRDELTDEEFEKCVGILKNNDVQMEGGDPEPEPDASNNAADGTARAPPATTEAAPVDAGAEVDADADAETTQERDDRKETEAEQEAEPTADQDPAASPAEPASESPPPTPPAETGAAAASEDAAEGDAPPTPPADDDAAAAPTPTAATDPPEEADGGAAAEGTTNEGDGDVNGGPDEVKEDAEESEKQAAPAPAETTSHGGAEDGDAADGDHDEGRTGVDPTPADAATPPRAPSPNVAARTPGRVRDLHVFEVMRNIIIEGEAGKRAADGPGLRTESRSGMRMITDAVREASASAGAGSKEPSELILMRSITRVQAGRGMEVLALAVNGGDEACASSSPKRWVSVARSARDEGGDDAEEAGGGGCSLASRGSRRSCSASSSRSRTPSSRSASEDDPYDDAEFSPTESESATPMKQREGRSRSRATDHSRASSAAYTPHSRRSSHSRSTSRSSRSTSRSSHSSYSSTADDTGTPSPAAERTPASRPPPKRTPARTPAATSDAARARTPAADPPPPEKHYDSTPEALTKSRTDAARRCTAMIRREREKRAMVIDALKENEGMKRIEEKKSTEEKKRLRDEMFHKFMHTRFEKAAETDLRKEIAARKAYWPVLLPTHMPNRMEAVRELWRSTKILEKEVEEPADRKGRKKRRRTRRRRLHELEPIAAPKVNKDFSALAKPLPRVYESVHPRYTGGTTAERVERPRLGPLKKKPATPGGHCESPLDRRSPLPSSTTNSAAGQSNA